MSKSLKTGAFAQDIYKQSSVQLEELDTIRILADGRMFAYSQAGAVALAAGKLTQSSVVSANANNETLAASAAIGATYLSVTFGGAVTANYYKDGWIYPCDDTGEGHLYRVKEHAAGTTAVKVYLKEPVRVAMTAGATTISAIANRQSLVIICPATLTSSPAGIPPLVVDIGYYFWNQVKGPAVCLIDGTVAIGEEVAPSNGTAGAVEALVHTTTFDTTVGTVLSVDATTEYGLINLAIPGY